jgi:hypothetical protein
MPSGGGVDRDAVIVPIAVCIRLVAESLRAGGWERGGTIPRQSSRCEHGGGGFSGKEESGELGLL